MREGCKTRCKEESKRGQKARMQKGERAKRGEGACKRVTRALMKAPRRPPAAGKAAAAGGGSGRWRLPAGGAGEGRSEGRGPRPHGRYASSVGGGVGAGGVEGLDSSD
jgi:hypothetical protein